LKKQSIGSPKETGGHQREFLFNENRIIVFHILVLNCIGKIPRRKTCEDWVGERRWS
jgi:hypothetical protein